MLFYPSFNIVKHSTFILRHSSIYSQYTCKRYTSTFSYILGAAWHPKPKDSNLNFSSQESKPWWKQRSQVGKVDSGEDAFYHIQNNQGISLGIADGVGGVAELGINPAIFPHSLMNHAASIAKQNTNFSQSKIDNENVSTIILDRALWATVNDDRIPIGASTACILCLSKENGLLTTSNIGDSSYHIIRSGKFIYSSPAQEHSFNCPLQLSVYHSMEKNNFKTIEKNSNDTSIRVSSSHPALRGSALPCSDADEKSHQLSHGDIIILATDGFTDNIFHSETIDIVRSHMCDINFWKKSSNNSLDTFSIVNVNDLKFPSDVDISTQARKLAKSLVTAAHINATDEKKMSPFSMEAQQKGYGYRGGKPDDITVLVLISIAR